VTVRAALSRVESPMYSSGSVLNCNEKASVGDPADPITSEALFDAESNNCSRDLLSARVDTHVQALHVSN
jgi:hypothetical protein